MVGDVGAAYLNASMPTDDPARAIHVSIDRHTAQIITKQDGAFLKYVRPDGTMFMRLDKALYGCIESARLWNNEISGKLGTMGFRPNPRDKCIFTVLIYPAKYGDLSINPVEMKNQLTVIRLEYTTELADQEHCSSYYQCVEVNSAVKSLSLKLSAYSVTFTEVDGG